jgi:PHD/YefM family antitoxin component YafN of YafNO toxin-antitoxin module
MHNALPSHDLLSNFATNPLPYLERLRQSGEPMVLTVEGHGEVVVQDAAAFFQLQRQLDRLETIAAVKEGLRDAAEGRTRPIREALAEIASKHKLPPPVDTV